MSRLALDQADAIVAGVADHTIAWATFDHARRSLGLAIMLSIASRLHHREDRALLMDRWHKRAALPAQLPPPEPLANGSLD